MKKVEILRRPALSLAAMAGLSVAALLMPAQSYADPSGAALCRPIPPFAGASVAADELGRCPASYVLVEYENPAAISPGTQYGGGGFAVTDSVSVGGHGHGHGHGR
jgi:hypothetical protein